MTVLRGGTLPLPRGGGAGAQHVSVTLPHVSACHTERDAFDTLFDHAPDKLSLVKKVRTFPQRGLHAGKVGRSFEISAMFATWIEV